MAGLGGRLRPRRIRHGISGGWRNAALELDPGGTREVTERVVEHESRRLHRVEYEDPETTGQLSVTFAIEGEGTMVTQELDYRLRDRGVFAKVTDRLFIRSQMRGSLSRSLARLRLEVEEVAAGTRP